MKEINTTENKIISFSMNQLLFKQLRFVGTMQQIFGVLGIISGSLTCLGIITAIVGVPLIIAGVKLFQSGKGFNQTATLGREEDIIYAIQNLHGYWKFQLIVFICAIVMMVIYFIFIFLYIFSVMNNQYY